MANRSDTRRGIAASWVKLDIPLAGAVGASLRHAAEVTGPAASPMPTPPLFLRRLDLVQPINGSATSLRSATQAQAVLLPEDLYRIVSPAEPIQVELSPQQASDLGDAHAVFPVAYDDEFFYIAGPPVRAADIAADVRGRNAFSLQVTRLPDLSAATQSGARERINVFRAIKLAFFKIVGVPAADTGLRAPVLENDHVTYRSLAGGELRGKGRIALLVHGFLSDSGWMAQALSSALSAAGYEHIVTWDYETFTTPIRDVMNELAKELHRTGVIGSERIDVIAHSMGTLVTRSLVAQAPSLGLVRRALLMGPPNAGTPIAGVGDFITELGSFYLNIHLPTPLWGPISPAAVVRFLWKQLEKGMRDMQPDSTFIRWLNENAAQQGTPMVMLVGNASDGSLSNMFQRLFRKGSDVFYGGPNDLVVPVQSMEAVTTPPFPSVAIREFASNHFDYLVSGRPARDFVEHWIKNP